MLKNLIFDVEGTLILSKWQIGLDDAIRINLKNYGDIDLSKFNAISKEIDEIIDAHKKQNEFYSDWLELTIDQFSGGLGLDLTHDEKIKIANEIDTYIVKNTILLDDVFDVLDNLYGKFNLYVITDGGLRNRKVLKKLGLNRFFTDIFTSEELKANKGSGKIFKSFINITNSNPSECLMVGDKVDSDGKCKLAGILFCLIDREEKNFSGNYDFKIKNLSEIFSIINKISDKLI